MPTLDERELGTVLAALRRWQEYTATESPTERFHDIATDCGTLDPLTPEEIDDLCEKSNSDAL